MVIDACLGEDMQEARECGGISVYLYWQGIVIDSMKCTMLVATGWGTVQQGCD